MREIRRMSALAHMIVGFIQPYQDQDISITIYKKIETLKNNF